MKHVSNKEQGKITKHEFSKFLNKIEKDIEKRYTTDQKDRVRICQISTVISIDVQLFGGPGGKGLLHRCPTQIIAR